MVSYTDLLTYASRLSAFTSAPPNMPDLAPGQPPPPLFFPPFPNEEKMRRGRLNEEAPLGQGLLGEARSVGRRESVYFCCCFQLIP
jgi:mediator of RNA polymerase II transcription subunit 4